MKKIVENRIFLVLVFVLVVVFVLQIIASGALAGKGEIILALENEIAQVVQENEILSRQVAENSSLSKVASRSAELGFAKPESIIYLGEDLPVAHLNAQSSP